MYFPKTAQLGCITKFEMNINLKDEVPVVYRPYRLSHSERKDVQNIINDLLENDVIQDSNSPYASPILLVRKKNGEQRLCVDYRALNAKTIKDKFPLPRTDELLEKLKNCRFFTTLDVASGYYQIPVNESSVSKTAFVTPDGHFEYKRMPFGLANAPAVFQRAMNHILGPLRVDKAIAYIDDVLIPSENFENGMETLKQVLTCFRDSGLTLRLGKCNFLTERVEYLGHEISCQGVQPGKLKCEAVAQFPTPTDAHKVRQFLGLSGYFRKYIRGYASVARPLTQLLKKESSFQWMEEQQKSFEKLKQLLTCRPVLAIYDPDLPTQVHTDASKVGIGGVLTQEQKDGNMKVVMYKSPNHERRDEVPFI